MKEFLNYILSYDRYIKRIIAIITDISACIICTWFALTLRLEEFILLKDFNFYPALISIIIAIPIFWSLGLYRTIFRYTGLSIVFTVLTSILVYGLLYFCVVGVYSIPGVPRSIGIIQPMLLFFSIMSTRLGIKFLLTANLGTKKHLIKKNVLVYGAGEAGRQLVFALENSPEFKVVGFLDDNERLHRQVLLGRTVYSPLKLEKLIQKKLIHLIFLALPTISRSKRNQIIQNLNKQKVIVQTLPSISEIVDGRIRLSDIKDFNIDDLLNRKGVEPDKKLLNKNIYSKTVLVTGAGGSIGSELCRQIARLKPNRLLLLELNEFALYKVYEELKNSNAYLKIIPLIVNTQDQSKLEIVFDTYNVDTVYHSAAYKHVPLVEENICEGVKNNVFSTLSVIKASISKNISNLVLISSDKAVRPTNIMGASKRLSELCMQSIYNHHKDISVNFAIVRFGNVLDSSGSVIPKFKQQIKEGGPVTLTHKNVTRYFMTLTEAAQLVIQAGAMGRHSEVFVLDMGESVKIIDIIEKMIRLSGLSVRNEKSPKGDIEIKITGLKPGEKLYEELLIGDNPEKTFHSKIKKINDPFITFEKLEEGLNQLRSLIDENKAKEVKNYLLKFLTTFESNAEMVDHIYVEQSMVRKNKSKLTDDTNVVNIR